MVSNTTRLFLFLTVYILISLFYELNEVQIQKQGRIKKKTEEPFTSVKKNPEPILKKNFIAPAITRKRFVDFSDIIDQPKSLNDELFCSM